MHNANQLCNTGSENCQNLIANDSLNIIDVSIATATTPNSEWVQFLTVYRQQEEVDTLEKESEPDIK